MILSYVSPTDKGDGVTDYDISTHPKPFTCPKSPKSSSRRFLGLYSKIKNKVSNWFDSKYMRSKHPDFFKSIFELSHDQGLDHECHHVTTEDGYILSLFRVKMPEVKPDAPVIFM